jgi:hypothetical protein
MFDNPVGEKGQKNKAPGFPEALKRIESYSIVSFLIFSALFLIARIILSIA